MLVFVPSYYFLPTEAIPIVDICDIYARFSKFLSQIYDSFELSKFQTQNMKAMVKDKKHNITVT